MREPFWSSLHEPNYDDMDLDDIIEGNTFKPKQSGKDYFYTITFILIILWLFSNLAENGIIANLLMVIILLLLLKQR